MIDTHKIFKRLTEAGVSEAEAQVLVETAHELDDSPTRGDLKELAATNAQTWRFFGIMAALILGGMYFLLSDIKKDIREIRNRVAELKP
jgi:hypothetical protein